MRRNVDEGNAFKSAVESTPDLKDGYRQGLRAMGNNSVKVSVPERDGLMGSCDIDGCTKDLYPEAARWDYVIGYKQKAWFVEVHPASTSNVDDMVKKVQWLEQWLKTKGQKLAAIRVNKTHYWIPSGKVRITKTSRQYHALAKHGIQITSVPFVMK